MTFNLKRDGKRILLVIAGALLMSVGLKVFARAGGLIPGGVSGMSLLLQRILDEYVGIQVPYTVINVILNAFPVYIGFRFIGKKFTLLSLLVIVLSSVFTDLIPTYAITSDPLLIAVFGAIINGISISLCLFADATSGGTDFIAIYLSQKKGVENWNIILAFNAVMLLIAGLFFGWDKALYSIIFQYISTQVLHFLYRNYQQQTLFVVTTKAPEICEAIYSLSHHGATIMDAEGSHAHHEYKMVYSVISGADLKKVMPVIREIDPDAFTNSVRTTALRGNFYISPKD